MTDGILKINFDGKKIDPEFMARLKAHLNSDNFRYTDNNYYVPEKVTSYNGDKPARAPRIIRYEDIDRDRSSYDRFLGKSNLDAIDQMGYVQIADTVYATRQWLDDNLINPCIKAFSDQLAGVARPEPKL